jgi:predicted nucleic acid-binding protein
LTAPAPPKSDAWIVDASVAVKWFFPVERESEGQLAREAIGQLAMRTTSLGFFEVGNVLTTRSSWSGERVGAALGLLLEICGDPFELTPGDHGATAELARAHDLTFYDASYVAIANRLGRRVLSADGDLVDPGLATRLAAALSERLA